ncbi:hypothetical protein HMPREF9371_1933, partial [Neisseria shayeganii 871]
LLQPHSIMWIAARTVCQPCGGLARRRSGRTAVAYARLEKFQVACLLGRPSIKSSGKFV